MSRSQSKAEYGRFAHLFVGGIEWLLSQWQALTGGEETDLHSHAASGGGSGPAWLMSGEGSPVDTVTPVQQGAVYADLTNGCFYVAVGATNEGWLALGGVDSNIGSVTGIVWNGVARQLLAMGGERNAPTTSNVAYFGDVWSWWNGSGQGVYWGGNGTDPNPEAALLVKTGASAEHVGTIQDVSGNMSMPGTITAANGFLPPTSDPHVAGALWNNAGTPAISAG